MTPSSITFSYAIALVSKLNRGLVATVPAVVEPMAGLLNSSMIPAALIKSMLYPADGSIDPSG